MKNNRLISVFDKIKIRNPEIVLSGSLALNLQGIKTRRNPEDLDLFIPYGYSFINDNEKEFVDFITREGSQNKESDFNRDVSNLDGVKIDIFQPLRNINPFNIITCEELNIRMIDKVDILKMKISHALDDKHSRFKHKDDIIFIMSLID